MHLPGLLACPPRWARATFPSLALVLAAAVGCATGRSGPGGPGGDGGTATTGTGGTGGTGATGADGGTGGTGADGGVAGSGGTGGAEETGGSGGATTTSSTTTTTTMLTCEDPPSVAGYGLEDEPNAIAALATPLADGTQGFLASICPPGDIDVFAIPIVTAGESLRVEVEGPGGGCPPGAMTYLRLFDSNNVLVAKGTNGIGGVCSLIAPENDPAVLSLPAGTYYAQVENVVFTQVPAYVVSISAQPPSCGDGLIQGPAGEQCDDGNVVPGDGCTADCLIEIVCGDGIAHFIAGEQCDDSNDVSGDGCSATCQLEDLLLTEVEPNTQAMPSSLTGYHGAIGSISPAGDMDWYSFEVTVPGSTVSALVSDGLGACPGSADTKIYLYDGAGALLADDDDDGPDQCSFISPVNDVGATGLAVGTYKIKVEEYASNDAIAMYVLTVNVAEPGCGDGVAQAGEQCDDGNVVLGDGCDDLCQTEAPWEIEPNDTYSAATPLWSGFTGWKAALQPDGDADWFSFTIQAGQAVTLTVHAMGMSGACPLGGDTIMALADATGAVILDDDDDGPDLCSMMSPALDPQMASLPAGTYYVQVQPFGGVGSVGPYELDLMVQ